MAKHSSNKLEQIDSFFFSMSECERYFFFLVVNHGRNPGNLLLVSKVIVCVTGAILLVLCLYV